MPSSGSICHDSSPATSYLQTAGGRRAGHRATNPREEEEEEEVTCPAGMDSKESEHPPAMDRSSGVRLSVDERLLARASSCTNMIPGETRGRRVGQAGQESSHSTNGAVPSGYTGLGANQTPPNPGKWITEENVKTGTLK